MAVKQTIAIIGATGSMGAAMAKKLSYENYRLLLIAHQSEDTGAIAESIRRIHPAADIDHSGCPFDASWEADIIVLAVHHEVEKEMAAIIRQVATQKIVVSVSNPDPAAADGSSAAEELQRLLPHAKIIKAFNTVLAADFDSPCINNLQADVLIAGNDEEALKTVSMLVSAAGFHPVVAGDLTASRNLESMGRLLKGINERHTLGGVAAWKLLQNQKTT